MPLGAEEVILAAYAVTGWDAWIKKMTQATLVTERMAVAEERLAAINAKYGAGNVPGGQPQRDLQAARAGLIEAQGAKTLADNLGSAVYQLTLMTGALYAAGRAWQSMIADSTRFHQEVMNIRDLSGASDRASFMGATQFEAAGIRDTAVMRDILRMTRASFSSQGQSALSMLGVPNDINLNGLSLFNEILDKVRALPSGQRRTKIIEDLFGSGGGSGMMGITALLPLLRMTGDQAKEAANIAANSYIPDLDNRVQKFSVSLGLMGQAIKRGIWDPIVSFALPPITLLINIVKTGAEWFGVLNKSLLGIPGALLGMAAAAITVAGAVRALSLALGVLGLVKTAIGGIGAVAGGILGEGSLLALIPPLIPFLPLIGAILGVGAVSYAAYSAIAGNAGRNDADDKFGKAVDKFTEGVNRLGDNFTSIRGSAFPSGVGERDISTIAGYSATLMAMG